MSNRGLLLVGEPGTAKSLLSELLSAAISANSTCTVQGTSGTTEDKITYSWNYALLIAEGPSPKALIPSPIYTAMRQGRLCRFEEITRVQPEIQDTLIGILSEKVIHTPELADSESINHAVPGFNIIATANLRDRGVHEMSSALKRRFAFETVHPIRDRAHETALITEHTDRLLNGSAITTRMSATTLELLITTFHDLREGCTDEGTIIEKPAAVMSSAEAVAVAHAATLDAHWLGDGTVTGTHIARQLIGTVLKDNPDDGKKLIHYFDVVVRERAKHDKNWAAMLRARSELTT